MALNKKTTEVLQWARLTWDSHPLMLARSDKGLCILLLGDDLHELQRELARRCPNATLAPEPRPNDPVFQQALGCLKSGNLSPDLPLDLRGTPFQLQVWQSLATIPAGHTCSYSELAAKVGRPRAVRAVASACGANPITLLIPCHRILAKGGGIGGYYWGSEVKRALLAREGVQLR
ncbi:MAG: methylated-DNA--[protein]-cysteine S-methyltransferase [Marinobacter sp.]|nr:methylated-DNA--[protein]-cysteine S-methyltransferase [Marinobacter sp.]